jgi:hypothetical protein
MRKSNPQTKGELEKLHAQADRDLTQKANEITEMNRIVEQTEHELLIAKSELAVKLKQAELENAFQETDEFDDDELRSALEQEVEAVKAQQQQELTQLRHNHSLHIKALKETYEKSIQEAEKWAETHAAAVRTERQVQLDQIKKQYDDIRATKADSLFTASHSRTQLYQQSKGASIQNAQRIAQLESQISEITAAIREEARDVKLKINECLASIELREREHQLQIATYENELNTRQTKYDLHIKQIEQEYAAEKKRLEQAIAAEVGKGENLKKLIKQFETTQKRSIQTGHQDIQKLKGLVDQYKAQSLKGLEHTRDSVSRTGQVERKCRQVKQEIVMVEQEIAELQAENAELREQLGKLDEAVYRRSG